MCEIYISQKELQAILNMKKQELIKKCKEKHIIVTIRNANNRLVFKKMSALQCELLLSFTNRQQQNHSEDEDNEDDSEDEEDADDKNDEDADSDDDENDDSEDEEYADYKNDDDADPDYDENDDSEDYDSEDYDSEDYDSEDSNKDDVKKNDNSNNTTENPNSIVFCNNYLMHELIIPKSWIPYFKERINQTEWLQEEQVMTEDEGSKFQVVFIAETNERLQMQEHTIFTEWFFDKLEHQHEKLKFILPDINLNTVNSGCLATILKGYNYNLEEKKPLKYYLDKVPDLHILYTKLNSITNESDDGWWAPMEYWHIPIQSTNEDHLLQTRTSFDQIPSASHFQRVIKDSHAKAIEILIVDGDKNNCYHAYDVKDLQWWICPFTQSQSGEPIDLDLDFRKIVCAETTNNRQNIYDTSIYLKNVHNLAMDVRTKKRVKNKIRINDYFVEDENSKRRKIRKIEEINKNKENKNKDSTNKENTNEEIKKSEDIKNQQKSLIMSKISKISKEWHKLLPTDIESIIYNYYNSEYNSYNVFDMNDGHLVAWNYDIPALYRGEFPSVFNGDWTDRVQMRRFYKIRFRRRKPEQKWLREWEMMWGCDYFKDQVPKDMEHIPYENWIQVHQRGLSWEEMKKCGLGIPIPLPEMDDSSDENCN